MTTNLSSDNRRILIIDDNTAIHADYRKILADAPETTGDLHQLNAQLFDEAAGLPPTPRYELDFVMQGSAGLDLVKLALAVGQPYAMAFIDVKMPPGWDGIETTARIWEVCPDLPVVICTAYSEYSWEEITARLGQTENLLILKKPFENVEVLQLANAMTMKWNRNQSVKGRLGPMTLMTTTGLQSANLELQAEMEKRRTSKYPKTAFYQT